MRVLVAGGAGFIGTHLCRRLLAAGHEVICADNYSTGSRQNIREFLGRANFRALEHDVTLPLDIPVEQIYNLASPASPVAYQRDPVQTTLTGVLGARNLLELARRQGARILQASTSEVYGDPEVHPQAENYWGRVNPIGPRACYDEGKRCAETLFFAYRRQYATDAKVVRIFNTYGPGMQPDDGRVISNFCVQALRGEPLSIYGDGRQTRSFCYVSDLVEGLLRMMDSAADFAGPVNLGNPAEHSIGEIAALVLDLCNSSAGSTFHALPEDDPRQRRPDIARARQALGWTPQVTLAEGLRLTVEHFRHQLG